MYFNAFNYSNFGRYKQKYYRLRDSRVVKRDESGQRETAAAWGFKLLQCDR
jgi:hypothetical protein